MDIDTAAVNTTDTLTTLSGVSTVSVICQMLPLLVAVSDDLDAVTVFGVVVTTKSLAVTPST
jgi:hypothetical protein